MFEWKLGLKIILAAVVTAGTGTAAYAYYTADTSSGIKVPEFVGNTKETVEEWISKYAKENQVKIVYDYSEDFDKDVVMDQSISEGSVLKDAETLQLTLSLGPDPEALFELPDFADQKREDIEAWFAKYHFTNVTYTYEAVEDASIEQDTFISMNPAAGTEVLRDAQIEVKLVTGDITVPDLASMSKDEIQAWGDQWGITISFEEEESSILSDGSVISVSAANGSTVKRGDTVTVKIAKYVKPAETQKEETRTQQTDTNVSAPAGSTSQSSQNTAGSGSATPVPEATPAPTNLCPSASSVPSISRGTTLSEVQSSFSAVAAKGCKISYSTITDWDQSAGFISYSVTGSDGNSASVVVNILN